MSVTLADLVAQMLTEPERKTPRTISNICPRCGVNERYLNPHTHKRNPYCKGCAKDKMKEYRKKYEV